MKCWFVSAITIEVANDNSAFFRLKLKDLIGRVDVAVAIGVNEDLIASDNREFINAITVEVTNHRNVTSLTEFDLTITQFAQSSVAIDIQCPVAVAEHADGCDAISVEVTADCNVPTTAEQEDVIDQVGASWTLRT